MLLISSTKKIYKKCCNYKVILFFYHLFFCYLAYHLRVERGISDSHSYWAQNININDYSWFDFADYGANFILFLNYPFIKLGMPFSFGFLIYGIIGYFGILKWIAFSEQAVGKITLKGYNLLPIFFFLPNLHYWTATLGKEPLVFLAIAIIFNFLIDLKKNRILVFLALLLLLFIRPHVALILFFSIFVVLLFQKEISSRKRILFLFFSLGLISVLSYMALQLSGIKYFNWNRILYFNEYSILSFKNSRAYVPMLDYSIWYKLFSFNFRPLFYDSYSIWMILASLENLLFLFFIIVTLVFIILNFKKIVFKDWMRIVFLFTMIASLIYVQRYANLGIFMRTKIMFQPFLWIAILYIIEQNLVDKKILDE